METVYFSESDMEEDHFSEYLFIDKLFNKLNNVQLKTSVEIAKKLLETFYEERKELLSLNLIKILTYILMKCYIWKMEESSLINKILMCISQINDACLNGGLYYNTIPKFCARLLKIKEMHIQSLQKGVSVEDERTFLQYVVFHATKTHFTWNGKNLTTLLYENFIFHIHYNIHNANNCILLLKYGANFYFENLNFKYNYDILLSLIFNVWKTFVRDAKSKSIAGTDKNVLCLSHLLKAIPHFNMHILLQVLHLTDRYSMQVINEVTDADIVPLLRNSFTHPAELKELCRYEIRRQLWTHNGLPDKIEELPLPSIIKSYLDLSE